MANSAPMRPGQGFDTIDANLELGDEADCRHFETTRQILKKWRPSRPLITTTPPKSRSRTSRSQVVERISDLRAHRATNERYSKTSAKSGPNRQLGGNHVFLALGLISG